MARPQLPKFGDWENDDIPYSAYFDNARKEKKNGQIMQHVTAADSINVEVKGSKASETKLANHERHSSRDEDEPWKSTGSPKVIGSRPAVDSAKKLQNHAQAGNSKWEPEAVRPKHDGRFSREEGDMKRLTDSPLHHETAGWRNSYNSPHHLHGGASTGDTPRRVGRHSVGSDRSTDHSPIHPYSQARVGGKVSGISSPSWEKKSSSDGNHSLAPSTPGRSRLRSVTRGDDSPDYSPAVPKFGDWVETDPATAEGYTQIFNKVREDKNSETGKVSVLTTDTSYSNVQKHYGGGDAKGCSCFPWCRGR